MPAPGDLDHYQWVPGVDQGPRRGLPPKPQEMTQNDDQQQIGQHKKRLESGHSGARRGGDGEQCLGRRRVDGAHLAMLEPLVVFVSQPFQTGV